MSPAPSRVTGVSAATPISQDLKLSAVHLRSGGYLTVAILCMNGTATA